MSLDLIITFILWNVFFLNYSWVKEFWLKTTSPSLNSIFINFAASIRFFSTALAALSAIDLFGKTDIKVALLGEVFVIVNWTAPTSVTTFAPMLFKCFYPHC